MNATLHSNAAVMTDTDEASAKSQDVREDSAAH